ncbi:MAG: hypothetical protein ACI8XO_000213 [Verrucomicrobiales bacterium]|jgi:hypothetical protein
MPSLMPAEIQRSGELRIAVQTRLHSYRSLPLLLTLIDITFAFRQDRTSSFTSKNFTQ